MSKKIGDAAKAYDESRRPENAKVFVDDGHIVIRDEGIELYDFPLSDANTAEGILGCLLTVSVRQWCTPAIVKQFIEVTSDLVGIKVNPKD